jgi:hypothetical protein
VDSPTVIVGALAGLVSGWLPVWIPGASVGAYGYDLFGVQTSFTLNAAGTSFTKTVDDSE